MAAPLRRLIVFSDLDGTLLDKQTYSWTPAASALRALRERGIPLVLCSSKTSAEMVQIRREMENEEPFVFENGGGAALPPGLFPDEPGDLTDQAGYRLKLFGADRKRILDALAQRRLAGDRFEGFADWTPEEVAAVTGLDREAARRAQDRLSTEPFFWRDADDKWPAFEAALAAEGIRIVSGGRFRCAMGRFDKADAVQWLLSLYRQAEPETTFTTAAFGDSANDIGMLSTADIAVVIRAPGAEPLSFAARGKEIRPDGYGPVGWAQAITMILEELAPQ